MSGFAIEDSQSYYFRPSDDNLFRTAALKQIESTIAKDYIPANIVSGDGKLNVKYPLTVGLVK